MKQIWEFDQSDHLPPTNRGVCMQLVAYWINLMDQNKELINNSPQGLEISTRSEAQKLQRFYSKIKSTSDAQKEAVTWRLRGMKVTEYAECSALTIGKMMPTKRTGYSMGIYFSDGGGHAIGMWRSGSNSGMLSKWTGHTYFFDPNVGSFKGDTSDFQRWIWGFLRDTYGTVARTEIATVSKAVAPKGGFSYV